VGLDCGSTADEGAARKEAARSSGSGTSVTLRYRVQNNLKVRHFEEGHERAESR
jgi:hypothetical protein